MLTVVGLEWVRCAGSALATTSSKYYDALYVSYDHAVFGYV
jgi:hypothetical protein